MTPHDQKRATTFLESGDFLLAAEILQRGLPQRAFFTHIKNVFARVPKPEPNDIHKSIARLPFGLTITTNFDTLLEDALRGQSSYTWQDTTSIFEAIHAKTPAIVKLHGSVSNPGSVRLTRTDYRDAIHAQELNECLKALLTWKTFSFLSDIA